MAPIVYRMETRDSHCPCPARPCAAAMARVYAGSQLETAHHPAIVTMDRMDVSTIRRTDSPSLNTCFSVKGRFPPRGPDEAPVAPHWPVRTASIHFSDSSTPLRM